MSARKSMWKVHAEVGGVLFDEFKKRGIVAIGAAELGDLRQYKTRSLLIAQVQRQWPEYKKRKAIAHGSQLYRFVYEVKNGDRMLTYDPSRRVYLVGTVEGDYIYEENIKLDNGMEETWPNLRKVQWEGEVFRDNLSVATKNALGAILTIFQINEEAANEIELALKGKPSLDAVDKSEQESEEEDLLKDIQARAIEFIKDKISRLDWSQMQELVAGLLRAMGYKTRISPAGPDKGKDIIASPDGFGFENPRIVVEVKHRSNQTIGANDIRSFLGGRHQQDKGLYVSTGGFTKEAHYEAERATIPLTLLTLDDLVQALIEHYDKMDIEMQRLVPLKKLYWPV